MAKWRDVCDFRNAQDSASTYLANKTRTWYLKRGYRLFKDGIHFRQQHERNLARAEHLLGTSGMRRKRQVFNALCVYVHRFRKSKGYWSMILGKMDNWMKRRAFLTWQNQGHQKVTDLLREEQNVNTLELEDLNTELGQHVNLHEKKMTKNHGLQGRHRALGQKILATTFGRWYYVKCQRAFE